MKLLTTGATAARAARAARLGLHPDENFAGIIRQYIADCRTTPGGEAVFKGLG